MCLYSQVTSLSLPQATTLLSVCLFLSHFAILFLIYKPLHLSSLNPNLHQWVWGNNYFLFSMIFLCGSISMLCFCASKTFLFVYRVRLILYMWILYTTCLIKCQVCGLNSIFFFSLKILTIGYGCWYFGF